MTAKLNWEINEERKKAKDLFHTRTQSAPIWRKVC